jgi:hypothetical protein
MKVSFKGAVGHILRTGAADSQGGLHCSAIQVTP